MNDAARKRADQIVKTWRREVGTEAVPERDYYDSSDYDVLAEHIAAALREQAEALTGELQRMHNTLSN